MNYKLLTGPFEGEIVTEASILDVPYFRLGDDIREAMADDRFLADDGGKENFEFSWTCEETNEPVTLYPLSSR